MYITHPRFRDVAIELLSRKEYKPGYIDIKFYWIYPSFRGRQNVRIFSTPSKLRMTIEKYNEFRGL